MKQKRCILFVPSWRTSALCHTFLVQYIYIYKSETHLFFLQLGALGLAGRLLLVLEDAAEDLAAGALGDGVDELDAALEPLVLCLVLLDVLLYGAANVGIGFSRGGGGLYDKRLGDLAGAVIGDGDNGAVVDVVVGEEVRLELGRGDLEALIFFILAFALDIYIYILLGELGKGSIP